MPKVLGTLYTVAQAAQEIGVSRSTLYRAVKARRVPHRVMGSGLIGFTDDDVEEARKLLLEPVAAVRPAVA